MIDLSKHKLELNYPCNWQYKLVVHHTKTIQDIISNTISDREHDIKPSKKSSKGKYKSYTLELLVHNEDDRQEIYRILSDHEHIKMVL
jgi:putative lipoic acid-binding regulatory protein